MIIRCRNTRALALIIAVATGLTAATVAAAGTAPAPVPRPLSGAAAATVRVTVEPFAPSPAAKPGASAAQQQAKVGGAPLPTPRPVRAVAALKAEPPQQQQQALTAPRPGSTTASTVRAAATIPNALKRDELSLLGVFGGTDTRRALLRTPAGSTRRVRQGDRIDAWTVSAIGPESVQLRNGSRTQTLRVP